MIKKLGAYFEPLQLIFRPHETQPADWRKWGVALGLTANWIKTRWIEGHGMWGECLWKLSHNPDRERAAHRLDPEKPPKTLLNGTGLNFTLRDISPIFKHSSFLSKPTPKCRVSLKADTHRNQSTAMMRVMSSVGRPTDVNTITMVTSPAWGIPAAPILAAVAVMLMGTIANKKKNWEKFKLSGNLSLWPLEHSLVTTVRRVN